MNHESANNLNKLKLSRSTSLVLPINGRIRDSCWIVKWEISKIIGIAINRVAVPSF